MAIEIKHAHQVDLVANPPDGVSVVQFDHWNAALVATMASGFLLGRTTGGNGAIEELTAAQVKAMLAYGTAANANTGTAAGNVPVLGAGGLLDASLLPAIAITDTFEVGSQAAMLALTAERGDIAIRTDLNKTFALAAEPASTLANWKELRTPTDAVLAVAGLTGTITAAALKTALALAIGDVSGLQLALDGKEPANASLAKIDSAQTWTGAQKFGREAKTIATTSGTALNNTNGNEHTRTVSSNTTFTVSGVPASGDAFHMRLLLTYTSGTITWFSGVNWVGGTAPTFTGGKKYEIVFSTENGGTTWRAAAGEYAA